MPTFARIAASIGLAVALSACGGGDNNSSSNPPGGSTNQVPSSSSSSSTGTTSTNWAGYARSGLPAQYTGITGTWVVPALTCDTGGSTSSSQWLGIGGYALGDQTLIQAGTGTDCSGNTPFYYAWWEALPLPIVTVLGVSPLQPTLEIHPGDVITTDISSTGPAIWTINIHDVTQGTAFSTTIPYTSSGESVEWIVEAPLNAGTSGTGQLELSKFGRVDFSQLTANGANAALSSSERITLVSTSGAVLASPSAPGSGGDTFAVCYGSGAC